MSSYNRRLGEFETVALTEGCTTMLRNKLPPKLKDLGSFTILCSIGNHYVGKTLCDLGAIDRSYAYPEGKIEDVLVRVDKFIFLADFIILECEADKEVPILLERPFLATGRTLIDVQKGELTMRVNDYQITFNVFDAMKCADTNEEFHAVEIIDTIVQEEIAKIYHNNCNYDADSIELTEA
ncbi:Retrovirus-related Pol polyprotein from transposon opus [Gossypium australe]|uniref:Retrovirus-related Pol polyprotein from transposon opus n=1 Tax=Gossypium australe TaxID=47621 RepID=A0A5B6WQA9_9ROSI|nr:Retrovirus-related Pol polyprotein from transposon opus [Gossypium australe]